MTPAYVANVVRALLLENGTGDTLVGVASLSFSWEIVLRSPSGVERHLVVPHGPLQGLVDLIGRTIASSSP
jgi:hypothetical protein